MAVDNGFPTEVTVIAVNDAPAFKASSPPAVNEDCGAQVIESWARHSLGPADEQATQRVAEFIVYGVGDPALFAAGPDIDTAGTLTFTPAPDANGKSRFKVILRDDGGTDSGKLLEFTPVADAFGAAYATFDFKVHDGSQYSVDAYAMTIDVLPANEPPVAEVGNSDATAIEGDTVHLSGVGSYDPDTAPNAALAYAWSYVSGLVASPGPAPSPSGDDASPAFVAPAAGTYTFRLTVDDGEDTDQADAQIVVGHLYVVTVAAGAGGQVKLGSDGDLSTSVQENVPDGCDSSSRSMASPLRPSPARAGAAC